jgi:hypothetical protein
LGDAGGDAGAVKEIGGQADDGLQVTGADELLADDGLGIAPDLTWSTRHPPRVWLLR